MPNETLVTEPDANVSILGMLGLGLAIVVIGRGIDISLVAALAVPVGFVLQLVDGEASLIPRAS